MVQLEVTQGYGHSAECSAERRVVISGLGWRAQCCELSRDSERETENMAAPEGEREARKRRERHDSGCTHERKERRALSEERMPPPPPPPPQPPRLPDHSHLESQRRAERLSRARRPQFGGKRRRPLMRVSGPTAWSDSGDEGRPGTPPSTHFDYVVTQPDVSPEEGVEGSRHEEAETVRRDERSVAPRRSQPSPDRRLEKINKKISVLKKCIAKYESDYEAQNGHAITPSDRITDVQLTRMHETLHRLQAEKRCIKADPIEYTIKIRVAKNQKERDEYLEESLNSDKPMAEIVRDIEEWLQGSRELDGRAAVPESRWTAAQLAAEKLCVQRVLLRLEASRGRPPAHSADRGAARHLYERYRAVKRALAALRNDIIIGPNGELATIHEHETIVFNSSIDSSSDSQEKRSDSSQEAAGTGSGREPAEEIPSSTSSAQSASEERSPANESLHNLSLEELSRALTEAKLHKCVIRRNIRDYEVNFELLNGRKVQKDDKKGNEEEYRRYKTIKARIKLLNALINKQKAKFLFRN
ncbi:unnamed protein product, partial [Iphiclides podalirius]